MFLFENAFIDSKLYGLNSLFVVSSLLQYCKSQNVYEIILHNVYTLESKGIHRYGASSLLNYGSVLTLQYLLHELYNFTCESYSRSSQV